MIMKPCCKLFGRFIWLSFLSIIFWNGFLTGCLGVNVYTNHFLVHTNEPGIEKAHSIAKRNGFINRGPVSLLFFI